MSWLLSHKTDCQIDATNFRLCSLPRASVDSTVDSQESSAIAFTRSWCCDSVLIIVPEATSHSFTVPSFDEANMGFTKRLWLAEGGYLDRLCIRNEYEGDLQTTFRPRSTIAVSEMAIKWTCINQQVLLEFEDFCFSNAASEDRD